MKVNRIDSINDKCLKGGEQLGINDKIMQNLLGHSSAVMTKDIYTHLIKRGNNEISLIMARLNERIESEYSGASNYVC